MNYTRTRWGCYIALFTQAVVNNLAPILFVIFQTQFAVSYESLGRLVLINFTVQLLTDLFAAKLAAKIGERRCMLVSHSLSAIGLWAMAILPSVMSDAYLGLTLATVIYAVGGGLNEVLASPILEALPSESKSASMVLLHSFYSWGQLAVVLLSSLFLKLAGADWRILPFIWSIVPLVNVFIFSKAPVLALVAEDKMMSVRELFGQKQFFLFLVIMLCAGASELCMSQWASMFAQKGLGVDKFVGDLAGPCMFAVFMGIGRISASLIGERVRVRTQLLVSAAACVVCYVVAAASSSAVVALCGCAFCGITVAVLWPATYSLGSRTYPRGGAAMFGLLAMAGDMGCSLGPWLTGLVCDIVSVRLVENAEQIALRIGLAAGVIFPLMLFICLLFKKEEA